MKKFTLLLLLLPAVLAAGCSSDESGVAVNSASAGATGPSEDTAEATMQHIMDGLQSGQPIVFWNSLPESYQKDLNGLVQTFGSNMDPEVWKQSLGLVSTIQTLLVDKGEFIANYPMLAESPNADAAKKAIPQIAGFLKTIIDGSSDLEALKAFDGATFMTSTGANLVTQLDAISQLAPNPTGGPNGLAAISRVKLETIESTDSTATLKITSPDGNEQLQEFIKVGGKWLPKDMTQDWDMKMASARDALAKLPEQTGAMKGQMMMVSGMAGGMLAPLQSAENQDQVNAALDGFVQSAMGLFMGGMGGPPTDLFGTPADTGEAPSDSDSSPDSGSDN